MDGTGRGWSRLFLPGSIVGVPCAHPSLSICPSSFDVCMSVIVIICPCPRRTAVGGRPPPCDLSVGSQKPITWKKLITCGHRISSATFICCVFVVSLFFPNTPPSPPPLAIAAIATGDLIWGGRSTRSPRLRPTSPGLVINITLK